MQYIKYTATTFCACVDGNIIIAQFIIHVHLKAPCARGKRMNSNDIKPVASGSFYILCAKQQAAQSGKAGC